MKSKELTELRVQRDKISLTIAELSAIMNNPHARACVSFGTRNGNYTRDYIFPFTTGEQIPAELKKFISDWCNTLIEKRRKIWKQIEDITHQHST
jgi:hypothetical protein